MTPEQKIAELESENTRLAAALDRQLAMNSHRKLSVFSVHDAKGGKVWTRAGTALLNRDGSWTIHLDVLPLDGQLHMRGE